MPGGLHPPLAVIFSWDPAFVNVPNRGWGIVILVSILLPLAYVVVGMRMWARCIMTKNAGIDDALIVFNLLPLTGLAICLGLSQKLYGFDKHVWDNKNSTLVKSRQMTMALEALYMISTVTTKISILLFYRRLATGTISNSFLYCVYGSIGFVGLYFFVFWINLFVGCHPLEAYWMQVDLQWNALNMGKYQCFDEGLNVTIAAVFSVIQDCIACGLPTVLLWKTRVPQRQKVALGFVFGIGFFLCVCGVLRIVYTVPIYYTTYDMTWESYPAWVWFALESHLAIVCASAPALKLFFKETLQVSMGSRSWRRKKANDSYELSDNTGDFSTVSGKNQDTSRGKTQWITTAADSVEHITSIEEEQEHEQEQEAKRVGTPPEQHSTFFNDSASSDQSISARGVAL
ncbi:hypothetical protein BT63DRAFT_451264 [Microthyrium microscopicum]|uniref:Rhodopsin domain-containing protein n=1 Tax=Microthyrium microscopicum TaxID=703497 RepID=A0A6A6ULW3_9PEZI|nr:hypothetical protein BT63DRAFT_451264 [Microthyrium microscopicum]